MNRCTNRFAIAIMLATIAMLLIAGPLVAQEESEFPNATSRSTALQQELSLDRFENAAMWRANISSDFGIAIHRRLKGAVSTQRPNWQPVELPQDVDERVLRLIDATADTGENVLGVRVDYLKRGFTSIFVGSGAPNTGSRQYQAALGVGGCRNLNHELSLIVARC